MRDILDKTLEQIRTGAGGALATLVRASGSTPQKPGSSALFDEQGLKAGTIGGGLLESEVQHIAKSVVISGASDHFYFNLNADQDSDGAICGGEADVLIDATPSDHLAVFEKIEESLSGNEDGFLLTLVGSLHDSGRTLRRHWISGKGQDDLPKNMNPGIKAKVLEHLKPALSHGFVEINLESFIHPVEMAYLEHIKPMPHLVIAGGGHIGQALAHLGSLLEFEITVVDDREEFASADHIPEANHLVVEDIGTAMREIVYGQDTYVVIVTRGHKQDSEALKACIGTAAAYIGMIGSSRKVGIIKKKFLTEQWANREQWSSLHTPIGLDIGSQTVQEIAISIAAQLVEVRSNKKRMTHE